MFSFHIRSLMTRQEPSSDLACSLVYKILRNSIINGNFPSYHTELPIQSYPSPKMTHWCQFNSTNVLGTYYIKVVLFAIMKVKGKNSLDMIFAISCGAETWVGKYRHRRRTGQNVAGAGEVQMVTFRGQGGQSWWKEWLKQMWMRHQQAEELGWSTSKSRLKKQKPCTSKAPQKKERHKVPGAWSEQWSKPQ